MKFVYDIDSIFSLRMVKAMLGIWAHLTEWSIQTPVIEIHLTSFVMISSLQRVKMVLRIQIIRKYELTGSELQKSKYLGCAHFENILISAKLQSSSKVEKFSKRKFELSF